MSVQVRTGGNWRTAGSGALYIRNGGSWRAANACYVKIGGVGAGYWYDSGYRGYPAVPSTPWVTGWDYSNVNVGWSAGGGGAPVSYYQLQRTDGSGNQMNLDNYGGGQSNNYGVNWNSYYWFRVQAISTGGLASGWSPWRYVHIGHPQQDTYGYVQRTRGWASDQQWNYRFIRENFAWYLGDNIQLNAIHVQNLRCGPPGNQGSSIVQRPGSNRLVSWMLNTGWGGSIFGGNIDVASGWSGDIAFPAAYFGGNGWWGMYPTANNGGTDNNTGWSASNTALSLYCDWVYIDGTEYYDNWELTNRIYEEGNTQWT